MKHAFHALRKLEFDKTFAIRLILTVRPPKNYIEKLTHTKSLTLET
jgi:hypothetical protein